MLVFGGGVGCFFSYINKAIWMPGKASSTVYLLVEGHIFQLAVDELQHVEE